jgi:uncharacterized membrane protein YphA (DoxX/SURF4 family)
LLGECRSRAISREDLVPSTSTFENGRRARREVGRDDEAVRREGMGMSWRSKMGALDRFLTAWSARYGVTLLRVSLGVVFAWFGALKFFPGASPAEALAAHTIERLSFGAISAGVSLPVLAVWEVSIGVCLIAGVYLRATILLLLLQMSGTVLPMLFFPDEIWSRFPFVLTLEGQYIVKNLVLVSAALAVGATVRGGGLVTDQALVALDRVRAR